MTQTDRVLAALYAHPERGITQGDFLDWPGIDGGGRITRVAARIEELREQGFQISSGERRNKYVVYRIQVSRVVAAAEHSPPAEGQEAGGDDPTLFDMSRWVPGFEEICPIRGEAA